MVLVVVVGLVCGLASDGASVALSDTGPGVGGACDELLTAQRPVPFPVAGQPAATVGETACHVNRTGTVTDDRGRLFDEVDVGIGGTAAGYADPNQLGNTRKDLTEAPNILFPQFGITSWEPGIGTYSGAATPTDAGAGIDVLYPDPASHVPWNGKVFVLAHGQSNDTPMGSLVPRTSTDGTDPGTFGNLYAGELIDAGYAVIYTRRPGSSGVPTTLYGGDGSVDKTLDESLNDNIGTVEDFAQSGERLLQERLGKAPSTVYWYGHSSGVILGRLVNYSGLNRQPHAGRFFDGFLDDDPGGGLPLPLSMPEGQVLGERGDVATYDPAYQLTAQAKAQFAPELTYAHELYQDEHSWLPSVNYLHLKLQGTKVYEEEGLGAKTRLYQVDGISHQGNSADSPPNTLDAGPLIVTGIRTLDDWVQRGVAPPPTMADLSAVGGHDTPGVPDAVKLPPIACPTGFRFSGPPPAGATSTTGYVPFDGQTLEPVNSAGVLEDFDGNGVRNAMPTQERAWHQLGLLGPRQPLNRETFAACVIRSTAALVQQQMITPGAAQSYRQQATAWPNLSW